MKHSAGICIVASISHPDLGMARIRMSECSRLLHYDDELTLKVDAFDAKRRKLREIVLARHPISYDSGKTFITGLVDAFQSAPQSETALSALKQALTKWHPDSALPNTQLQPYSFAEYFRECESLWMKRLFLNAAQKLAAVERVDPGELDELIARIASKLGIDEDTAIRGIPDQRITVDEFIDWLDSCEIDYLAWDNHQHPGFFWVFPYADYPVKEGALIHVYEGQAALFVHDDRVYETFQAGTWRFKPENLPSYASATAWTGGSIRPDVVFVKTDASHVLRWGLPTSVQVNSPQHGVFEVSVYGRCVVGIVDPALIHRRFNSKGMLTTDAIEARLARLVGAHFHESYQAALDEHQGDPADLVADIDTTRRQCAPFMKQQLLERGIALMRFEIENVTLPTTVDISPFSERGRTLGEVGNQVLGDRVTNGSLVGRSSREQMAMGETSPSLDSSLSLSASESGATSYDFTPTPERDD